MTIKFGAPYSSLLPPWKQALSPFDGGILDPHGADGFRQGSSIWNPASVRPDRGPHVITYEALIDACLLGPGGPPTDSVTDISQQLVGLWRILICRVAQGIGVTIKAPTLPGPLVLLSVAEARHGLPDLMSRASQGSIASIAKRRDPDSMVAIVDWRMPHLLTHMILGNPIDLPNVTGRRIAYLDLMHELMPAPSSLDILGGRLIGQLGDAVQYWARGWGVEISPDSLPTSTVEPQLTRVRSALPKVIDAARSRHEIGVLSKHDRPRDAVALLGWRQFMMLMGTAAQAMEMREPFGELTSAEIDLGGRDVLAQMPSHRPLSVRQSAADRRRAIDELFGRHRPATTGN